uniref:Strictosidine synthase conserved region domain-containing protein n=1 Tax=Leersia perrieri TaxID=77586 RepID=A0A0D9V8I5_9ORYZ
MARGNPMVVLLLVSLACLLSPSAAIKTSSMQSAAHLPLPDGVTGAGSLAFDAKNQGPYTGVSDGRVLRWSGVWTTFAYHEDYSKNPKCATVDGSSEEMESTCGRDLYIADAYKGLMRVGPRGGEAEVLATEADGVPFNFVNGVDIDQDTGDVYFTDSSTTYTRRSQFQILVHRDATARLLKYDAQTNQVTVLRAGLPYANGVAVSQDGNYIVVAHTGPAQVFRYWIRGSKIGQYELFADLPGYPDNVRRDTYGGYWVALNREKIQVTSTDSPVNHVVGVRLNSDGVVVEELTTTEGTLSEVVELNNKLWLGSVNLDFVGQINQQ